MAERKRFEWKLRTRTLQLGDRALIVAILNITPDSFSDGGKYTDPDRAVARALELQELGADILDIGAESTKPRCGARSGSRGTAATGAGAQEAGWEAEDPDFGGYLQGRGGRTRGRLWRGDH